MIKYQSFWSRKASVYLLLLSLCLVHLVTTSQPLQAQGVKNIDQQELGWIRLSLSVDLNDRWTLKQNYENRFYVDTENYFEPIRQHHLLFETTVYYKLGEGWAIAPGFTHFTLTLPQDPDATFSNELIELRPRLALQNKRYLSNRFSLFNRYQAEWRYFEDEPGSMEFEFRNTRLRYKLEGEYRLNTNFSVFAFNEVMVSVGENAAPNVFDQNRASTGIRYAFLDGAKVGFSYLHWYQQQSSGVDFFNRHIALLNISYNFKLKPKSILD